MAHEVTVLQPPSKAATRGIFPAKKSASLSFGMPSGHLGSGRGLAQFRALLPGEVACKGSRKFSPVLECPQVFYSADARFQTDLEVREACREPGPLPFLLRNGRVFAFSPFATGSVLAPAIKPDGALSCERLTDWLAIPQSAAWAIELLDRMLRYHAWKRGLRFDETHKLFYFTRSKPKSVNWKLGGCTIRQEVTAPRMVWTQTECGAKAEAQFGWRHRAVRAGFTRVQEVILFFLEPTWFLTELDGKTASTAQRVGPADTHRGDCQGDLSDLRSLLFWSKVFTKGHRELRIDAGRHPIRVRLASESNPYCDPASDSKTEESHAARANAVSDEWIPELVPLA